MIIGIAGKIGSGKSYLSEEFAHFLSCKYTSFGALVRLEARKLGLVESRENLQSLGAKLVSADLTGFCLSVLRLGAYQKNKPLIIDGIRHFDVLTKLKELAEGDLILFYVETPEQIRLSRLQSRGKFDIKSLQEVESHSTEVDVQQKLKNAADSILAGDVDFASNVPKILPFIKHWLSAALP